MRRGNSIAGTSYGCGHGRKFRATLKPVESAEGLCLYGRNVAVLRHTAQGAEAGRAISRRAGLPDQEVQGVVILDGLMCEGTRDLGCCDRSCFYFWRKNGWKKADEKNVDVTLDPAAATRD